MREKESWTRKRAHMARTRWYRGPFRRFINTSFFLNEYRYMHKRNRRRRRKMTTIGMNDCEEEKGGNSKDKQSVTRVASPFHPGCPVNSRRSPKSLTQPYDLASISFPGVPFASLVQPEWRNKKQTKKKKKKRERERKKEELPHKKSFFEKTFSSIDSPISSLFAIAVMMIISLGELGAVTR